MHHIPGPTNQLANCLSILGIQNDSIKLPKLHHYLITNQLNTRSDSLNQFHVATLEYNKLVLLKHTITHGWANTIKEVPNKIQAYWTFWEGLTIEDGLALKGTWIVIPKKKCNQILKMINKSYLGLGKCKLWVKDTVNWPGIKDQ